MSREGVIGLTTGIHALDQTTTGIRDSELWVIGARPAVGKSAFARQIARIQAGTQEPVIRAGALDRQRDFMDVRDVCAAYAACLTRADAIPPGTILNLASGTSRRIADVLEQLVALAGVKARIETDVNLVRSTDIAVAAGDASRARILLEWEPRIPWQTTLMSVLADWQTRLRS